ncbi:MAG TPA: RsmE family RNA methyltransferase [Balneolaceae bacterium]|nr:RsmE family RNA methyltransferase [Balneolaceae bacterium]
MNIFYTPPSQIQVGFAEITGQEATHASRVMRAREGDPLTVVDGKGGWYEGVIRRIIGKSIRLEIQNEQKIPVPQPELVLGMGIIKKRDRLEFAVEKAVELGASRICLFRGDHTIKQNVRMDRLESIALSAMKQSLRAWLPEISLFHSFEELLEKHKNAAYLAAHEKVNPADANFDLKAISKDKLLLLIGPEGGFSDDEIQTVKEKGGKLVSLGQHRLRSETAMVVFLSRFAG